MTLRLAPSEDLGLRHVLENGLALIRGEEIEPNRRDQVLEALIKMFSEAKRGSQVLCGQNLLASIRHQPDFERFNLFYRYLPQLEDQLSAQLADALKVFETIRDGRDADKRFETENLIKSFLSAIEEEKALSPLVAPTSLQSFQ